jgi:hypothetical protein
LVDKHRRVGPADRLTQAPHQGANLIRRFAVAREQDEPERLGVGKEAPLFRLEARAGAAENYGSGRADIVPRRNGRRRDGSGATSIVRAYILDVDTIRAGDQKRSRSH